MNLNMLGLKLRCFARDDAGATAIEYGLIALGIAIVIISAVQTIGTDVSNIFADVDAGF